MTLGEARQLIDRKWSRGCACRLRHAYVHDMDATSIWKVAIDSPLRGRRPWLSAFCGHTVNIDVISNSLPLKRARPLFVTLLTLFSPLWPTRSAAACMLMLTQKAGAGGQCSSGEACVMPV